MGLSDHARQAGATPDPRAARDRAAAARLLRQAEADRRQAAAFLASAYRDELTGALLRRPGREQLEAAIARAREAEAPLYIVFFDVDSLKDVNDREGHLRGDEVLASTGAALRRALRSDDVIVRYGGDEFVCALTAMTGSDAMAAIRRVRRHLARLAPAVAVSAGYALVEETDRLDDVIARADADLYARRRGRRAHDRSDDAVALPSHQIEGKATLACGACAGRIALTDFVLVNPQWSTRVGDCPECGETTVISLAASDRSVVLSLPLVGSTNRTAQRQSGE